MIIAPSVLSLDYTKFNEQVQSLNENVPWLHFDVMDGHFVPNLSFGPDILKAFKRASDLYMDVHIMVSDPDFFSDVFYKAGASGITFHYEALEDDEKRLALLKKIKSFGLKAGISIKPKTDPEVLIPLLEECDLVLLMSVEPGFGGQAFQEGVYPKIQYLNEYRQNHKLNYLLEVDGGVSDQNAKALVEAGIDVLVAGSFVFKGDIQENILKIENAVKV